MKWANFLHIYQPPNQKAIWVKRIANESYKKLVDGLAKIPKARITLNINSVLCELLEKNRAKSVIEGIKALVDSKNIELTGSAKYHAFLPLLPESEIERQIKLNEEGLTKYFGNHWKRGGFFSPEMAYSKKVATVAKRMGYKYIIIDEMAFPDGGKPERNKIYEIAGLEGFYVFFRGRNFSFKILSASHLYSLPALLKFLEPRFGQNEYTVTGMDGETFGHHRPGLEKLFFSLLSDERIEPISLIDVLDMGFEKVVVEPRESTWASLPRDFALNQPFSRWSNPENQIQKYQWELTNLAIDVVHRYEEKKPREILDQALHSDQYWWSSAKPWWSLEMIESGAYDLRHVIQASKHATLEENSRAEELYKLILFTGFEWQRTGLIDKMSKEENEELRERLEEKEKIAISKEEFEEMIKSMTEQMNHAADTKEFHRAATLKDRIRELEEEMEKTGTIGGVEKPGADLMF